MGNKLVIDNDAQCREIIRQEKIHAYHQSQENKRNRRRGSYLRREITPEPEVTDFDVYVRQSKQAFPLEKWTNPTGARRPVPVALPEHSLNITETDKGMLRDSWITGFTHDLAGTGARVFQRIHQLYPKIAPLFKYEEDENKMLEDHRVRSHGEKFMHAIGSAVIHVDNLSTTVAPAFVNLGKHHVNIKNLDPEYFSVFTGAMMFIWKEELGDSFTLELRQAWLHLFDYLILHVRFGYNYEREQRKLAFEKQETDGKRID